MIASWIASAGNDERASLTLQVMQLPVLSRVVRNIGAINTRYTFQCGKLLVFPRFGAGFPHR